MKNVRKILMTLLVCALLMGTAWAALTAEPVTYAVMVNGEVVRFTEEDGLPVNINGRTFLPVRAMANALGIPIEWKNNRVEIETIDLERLKDSCVMVYAGKDGKYLMQGSGVIIDYDEVLTAYHVVGNGYDLFQIFYDDNYIGENCNLASTVSSKDAAILTPSNKAVKPVKIGDSDEVKINDTVYVVSSPKGEKNTVIKASVIWYGTVPNTSFEAFAVNAKTSGGSSGGACFNINGELIGIITGGDDKERYCYVVPINHIRQALAN